MTGLSLVLFGICIGIPVGAFATAVGQAIAHHRKDARRVARLPEVEASPYTVIPSEDLRRQRHSPVAVALDELRRRENNS